MRRWCASLTKRRFRRRIFVRIYCSQLKESALRTIRASRYPSHFVGPSRSHATGGKPSEKHISEMLLTKYWRHYTHKKSPTKSAFRQRGTSSPHRSIYYYYLIYYWGNYVYPPPSRFQKRSKELTGYVVNNNSSCTKSYKSTNILP